jgi:hypothetical protein
MYPIALRDAESVLSQLPGELSLARGNALHVGRILELAQLKCAAKGRALLSGDGAVRREAVGAGIYGDDNDAGASPAVERATPRQDERQRRGTKARIHLLTVLRSRSRRMEDVHEGLRTLRECLLNHW